MDYEYVSATMADQESAIPERQPPAGGQDAYDESADASNTTSGGAPDPRPGDKAAPGPGAKSHRRKISLQDRVFAKLLEQLIPPADDDGTDDPGDVGGPAAADDLERPGFSLPLMTNNFRRFNARIGVVFVFQARAIRLFSWQTPSHTLSFLAIYTFICVYPFLLFVAPLWILLLFVMVPAYLARHPPPPTEDAGPEAHALALAGPAFAPARVVKPAPELSHDFFRNMRDLQNSMSDFATLHDAVLRILTPWTNFADEARSSATFLGLTVGAVSLLLIAPLIPVRTIALLGGWALIGSNHPRLQHWLQHTDRAHGEPARRQAASTLQRWISEDFTLDDSPEILEVEIFELQRLRAPTSLATTFTPPTASPAAGPFSRSAATATYEPWLFSPSPWEPQAPARRAGARPPGTRFFEDVRPPPGWAWAGKKWLLDPGDEGAGEDWIAARLLRGLEVEREGEHWVYDLVDVTSGNSTEAGAAANLSGDPPRTPRKAGPAAVNVTDEKEAVVFRGEWRRRRWVRSVKRAKVAGSGVKVVSDVSGGPARGR